MVSLSVVKALLIRVVWLSFICRQLGVVDTVGVDFSLDWADMSLDILPPPQSRWSTEGGGEGDVGIVISAFFVLVEMSHG